MPHDRQLAEIGGSHWSRGSLPYHTSGTYGAGKSMWRGSSLPVNYQEKEAGSPPLPGHREARAHPQVLPLRRQRHLGSLPREVAGLHSASPLLLCGGSWSHQPTWRGLSEDLPIQDGRMSCRSYGEGLSLS